MVGVYHLFIKDMRVIRLESNTCILIYLNAIPMIFINKKYNNDDTGTVPAKIMAN